MLFEHTAQKPHVDGFLFKKLQDPKAILGAIDAQGNCDDVFRAQNTRLRQTLSRNLYFYVIGPGKRLGVEIVRDRASPRSSGLLCEIRRIPWP